MSSISETLSRPDIDDLGQPQDLEPILPDDREWTVEAWEEAREELLSRWQEVVGEPSFDDFERSAEVVEEFEASDFRGTIFSQTTGPDQRQKVLLMEPRDASLTPAPGAVVPFYHPDTMAGFDLEERAPITDRPNVQFGRHLVQQGYRVVCPEAFPYNTVPEPDSDAGHAWWRAAAEKLLADNPRWTGIGKLIHDTSRAVDLLLDQTEIDTERILAIGHSLGGKMAFYTAAFDPRITACIPSDFGIGMTFTNWADPWYFGEQIERPDFTLNGHQALALIAPRSFLLIAGQADRPASWQHIQQAQQVYRLYGREHAAGCFVHMTGHQPTEESIRTAYAWLDEQFGLSGLPGRPWQPYAGS